MEVDYIIVGCGLAGIAFAETAFMENKSFVVFDNNSQNSSKVAGGLYNPVILKRFSEVWDAQNQIEHLNNFYDEIETRLNVKFNFKMPIYRKFFSVEEQNNWFAASDKPNLSPFLSNKIIRDKFKGISSNFDYGEVLQTGYVDTSLLLDEYQSYLLKKNIFYKESFLYDNLVIEKDFVVYKGIKAKQIVFAEGFGLHSNPFFNFLPLDGTKGELFIIKAPELDLNVIVNTSVFILPLGDNLFKVGATYNWKDKTDEPTKEGKEELIDRIKEILTCEFEVIKHFAGVRPTVNDRRPLLGNHPIFSNLYVLNGMGTRGVMLAPSMAKVLYKFIENKTPLDKTIDIKRYANLF